jgi:hypothetical protein
MRVVYVSRLMKGHEVKKACLEFRLQDKRKTTLKVAPLKVV